MNKIIGYGLSGLGIIIIAIGSIKPIRDSLPIPAGLKDLYIMFVGLILVIIGVALIYASSSSSKKVQEVPIYQGKEVVGFRRLQK